MVVSYIITTSAIYQCGYIKTRKCGNITAFWKFTNKKRTPEIFTSIFLDHSWKLHFFFNHSYSWILQIIPALPFPQEISYPQPVHVFLVTIIKSGMHSYTTLYILFFKVGLSSFKQNSFICFDESLLKMMKSAFYFILKALSVLKIFNFLSWLFGHAKKRLD